MYKINQINWLSHFLQTLTVLILIHQTGPTSAQLFYQNCNNKTMFANESTYQTNLNTLFHNLVSNATDNPSGYHQATVGNPSTEAIYGHYLCNGDLNTSACHQCVNDATTTGLPKVCLNMKIAIVWYEQCMVRYSNTSFFNSMALNPAISVWNNDNIIGDKTSYMDAVTDMIGNVIALQAAEGGNFKKFATDFKNYSAIQPIYMLGQCTPNLNSNDCYMCLHSSIQNLRPNPGGRVLGPSCIIRFEAYPFFNLSYLPQAPLPSPLPSPSPSPAPASKPIQWLGLTILIFMGAQTL